jgi:hypothetical protein
MPQLHYPRFAGRICEAGGFGQKAGAGWYDYHPGERETQPSPIVDEMIVAYSEEIGSKRRTISNGEIVERLVYALVNEGARVREVGAHNPLQAVGAAWTDHRRSALRRAPACSDRESVRIFQGPVADRPEQRIVLGFESRPGRAGRVRSRDEHSCQPG